MSIQTKIDTIIKSVGSINIQDFVEISNFDKDSGFYNKPNIEKIGKDGQFMTSPEISSLFSMALTNQFLKEFPKVKNVNLLELGPGNGILTLDIYHYLKSKNINVNNITLLERSDYFKGKIFERSDLEVNFIENIYDYEIDNDDTVFIYSNEFFDALGSKQFIFNDGNFNEIKISKENNPPKFKVEFFNDQENIENINCYSNEGDKWMKSNIKLLDKELTIEFREPFLPRRGRINCSVNDNGKWRWFGTQFIIR